MAGLPSATGAGGVNDAATNVAQQQLNFQNLIQFLRDLFGSGDSVTARATVVDTALGGIGTIAAAAATNLASVATARTLTLTNAGGAVAITSFGVLAAGAERTLRVTSIGSGITLTHNAASLICPGAQNASLQVGDVLRLLSLGGGNWVVVAIERAWGGDVALEGAFRNRIINGDMRIDQRASGASTTPTASGYYSCDRWSLTIPAASKLTVGRNLGAVTPPAGFDNYLGFSTAAAYAPTAGQAFTVGQAVEGSNVADYMWGTANAKPVTIGIWVRSSLTGNHSGVVRNSALNRSHPFTVNIAAANTWEYKTITIPGDTAGTWLKDNGVGLSLSFNLGSNADQLGAAGAWAAANYSGVTGSVSVVGTLGATFYFTGVQTEEGGIATPFERRDYARELLMCQRYFESGTGQRMTNYGAGAQRVNASTAFKVTKRAAPTVTVGTGAVDFTNTEHFQSYSLAVAAGAEYTPGNFSASSEF